MGKEAARGSRRTRARSIFATSWKLSCSVGLELVVIWEEKLLGCLKIGRRGRISTIAQVNTKRSPRSTVLLADINSFLKKAAMQSLLDLE
jgi:hypothetical protein